MLHSWINFKRETKLILIIEPINYSHSKEITLWREDLELEWILKEKRKSPGSLAKCSVRFCDRYIRKALENTVIPGPQGGVRQCGGVHLDTVLVTAHLNADSSWCRGMFVPLSSFALRTIHTLRASFRIESVESLAEANCQLLRHFQSGLLRYRNWK